MIRINLLPPESRKKSSGLRVRIPWREIGLFVFVFVVLSSSWILGITQIQTIRMNFLKAQSEKLKEQRSRVEKIEVALNAFRNRAALFKGIKDPAAQWAPRLNILSDAIVAKLWFTSLEYKPAEGVVETKLAAGKKEKSSAASKTSSKTEKAPSAKKPPAEAAKPTPVKGKEDKQGKQGTGKGSKGSKEQKPKEKLVSPIVLQGSFLVSSGETEPPVNRYIHRVKEHPEFSVHFKDAKVKTVEHRQVQNEEVADFVIELFPKEG